MGLFRRKRKAREMADKARDVIPGVEPRQETGIGTAGYPRRASKKVNQPRYFKTRRPDGQPTPPKKVGARRRGFFS